MEREEIELNRIYNADCLESLRKLPDNHVQCCITSPPYWNLRDYGVAGQIGMEKSPEVYVRKLVAVFKEVKRVLKTDGVLFLNLGDAYWGSGKAGSSVKYQTKHKEFGRKGKRHPSCFGRPTNYKSAVYKPKDLIGLPWMVAFALRLSGWYLRQDIIWYKPNPMPESVTDRCTKAHEYIFLFAKNRKYYFNHNLIKTEAKGTTVNDRIGRPSKKALGNPKVNLISGPRGEYKKANRRSVWTVTNRPFKGAHFATFPPEIPKMCILAGSKEGDIILDPFMGAGTTALVAKALGRKYIGFELNADYVKIAEERLENENWVMKLAKQL